MYGLVSCVVMFLIFFLDRESIFCYYSRVLL